MEKRSLGPGGPLVSVVGYGAMSLSDFYGPTTEEAGFAVLDAARDLGIDHLDTANVYGMGVSETVIGRYLAREGASPFRIATKASFRSEPDAPRIDNSLSHLRSALEASLTRLGVEAVDLFYAHRRAADTTPEELAEALGTLVREGKTKAIGLSEVAPSTLRRAFAVHPVAAVQSEFSLATRFPELGLMQACEALGTALVAFCPVGRGVLTDRAPDADIIAQSPFLKQNPRFQEPNLSANQAQVEGLRAIARDLGVPTGALAIAWVLARNPSVIAIPGTRSPAHLSDLCQGAGLVLSPEILARIDAALPPGWAHGDRYSDAQWVGPERYC